MIHCGYKNILEKKLSLRELHTHVLQILEYNTKFDSFDDKYLSTYVQDLYYITVTFIRDQREGGSAPWTSVNNTP